MTKPKTKSPGGRCIICGSAAVTWSTRDNCVLCLDCGSDLMLRNHRAKQPSARKPTTDFPKACLGH